MAVSCKRTQISIAIHLRATIPELKPSLSPLNFRILPKWVLVKMNALLGLQRFYAFLIFHNLWSLQSANGILIPFIYRLWNWILKSFKGFIMFYIIICICFLFKRQNIKMINHFNEFVMQIKGFYILFCNNPVF